MGRAFNVYAVPASGAHVQGSTSSTATFTAPTFPNAVGCIVAVAVNDAYLTFDGSTPSSSNGLLIKQGTNPQFFPLGNDIKVAPATGSTTVNVLWLT